MCCIGRGRDLMRLHVFWDSLAHKRIFPRRFEFMSGSEPYSYLGPGAIRLLRQLVCATRVCLQLMGAAVACLIADASSRAKCVWTFATQEGRDAVFEMIWNCMCPTWVV